MWNDPEAGTPISSNRPGPIEAMVSDPLGLMW